jgi:hypothetical protein
MSDRSKKIFLFTIIVGSFLAYSIIYYAQVLRDAPYNFKEFKSFVIKYGTRDKMLNYYNSTTGEYDHLNRQDSLIKGHLQLTMADLDSLHKGARDLGFWDFPDYELSSDTANPATRDVPRYFIQFNYKRKSKQVLFDANFKGPARLVDANKNMVKRITDILNAVRERQAK